MTEFNDYPIRFDIFTRRWDPDQNSFVPDALKAAIGEDNKMRLRGIASSTVEDLHGDTIEESALLDMEGAANQNLTIFGNHGYVVPEDVYGSVEKAFLRRNAGVDDKGKSFHVLDFDIAINDENERAVKTWKAIQKGTRLGLSIGAMIPKGGAVVDRKSGTLVINHLNLIETSIVGIPANPKSWVENAVKSFKENPRQIEPVLTSSNYFSITTTGAASTSNNILWSAVGETEVDNELELITDAAGCPTCGKGHDAPDCDDKFHKDVDPDLEKVRVRVTVDTDEKTPAAPASEPTPVAETPDDEVTHSASETVASAQEVVVGLDAEVTSAFDQMANLVEKLTSELISARAAKVAAEQERDSIVTEAGEMIASTKSIITKLAGIPLGPRAAVDRDHAAKDLSNLEGIYSREFLELLRS